MEAAGRGGGRGVGLESEDVAAPQVVLDLAIGVGEGGAVPGKEAATAGALGELAEVAPRVGVEADANPDGVDADRGTLRHLEHLIEGESAGLVLPVRKQDHRA